MKAKSGKWIIWSILTVLVTVGFLVPLGCWYLAISAMNQLGHGMDERPPKVFYAPEWTPDGSQIVFGHDSGIYTVNRDGSALNRIHGSDSEDYHFRAPRISPDGSRIAYSRYLENRRHWITMTSALDGSGERTLTKSVSDSQFGTRSRSQFGHAWSPDSSRVAFFNNSYLYTIGADGSDLRRLAERDFSVFHSHPVWSPDGSRIAFAGWDLHMVETDGSGATKLVKEEEGTRIGFPTWSPDGSRIAFAKWSRVPDENDLYSWQIITLSGPDLDTAHQVAGGLRHHSVVYGLDWSPDGANLLISGYNFVSAVSADGSDLRHLVNLHPGYHGHLKASWSPDGSRIAMYSRGFEGALFTMSSDGSDKRVLALNGNPLRPAQNQAWDSAYDAPTPTPAPMQKRSSQITHETDCPPHPFGVMALEALCQTARR